MEKKPLATEIITDMQDKINCILMDLEAVVIDIDKSMFPISEIAELAGSEIRSNTEALEFAYNHDRIFKYADIAYDYVSRVKSDLEDLIIRTKRIEPDRRAGMSKRKIKTVVCNDRLSDCV